MPDEQYLQFKNGLDASKRITAGGTEYWMGRELMKILAYASWDKFEHIIQKAIAACHTSNIDHTHHFSQTGNMVAIGSGAQRERADWYLTRYACYLIAMNADSSKAEVSFAMTYFAVQTRKQELSDEEKRLELRMRIMHHNRVLAGVAKQAGVTVYAFFQDSGYRGLYRMGLSRLKSYKGVGEKEDLLNRVGRLELAANDFRITLAEHRLKKDGVQGQETACLVHETAGSHVREAIMRDHGQCPEDLPVEPSIQRLVDREKRRVAATQNVIE